MPGYDDAPKPRTEQKRSGKKDKGPYSARHVRAAEALREARQRPPAADAEALREARQAAAKPAQPAPKKR
jgi:hypothetical protein